MQNHQVKHHTKKENYSKFYWRTIFLKNSGGISSKRVIAILGTLISFVLLIAAFVLDKEVPEFGEVVFIGCLSLYGTEMVSGFWQKNITKS